MTSISLVAARFFLPVKRTAVPERMMTAFTFALKSRTASFHFGSLGEDFTDPSIRAVKSLVSI